MDKPIVKELIQNEFTAKNLKKEFDQITEKQHRASMFAEYYDLEQTLGGTGASINTANLIVNSIS